MDAAPPELVMRVPGCGQGEVPLRVQALAGGRGVNGVWRVRTREGDFVLRLRHEPIDRPGSFSRFELAAHRLAAAAGLAPDIVEAAEDGRWLVMEYVDAPVWGEAQLLSDPGIIRLGVELSRLHSLDCPEGLPHVDVAGIARGYLSRIEAGAPEHAREAEAQCAAIEVESREMDGLSGQAVLNHGDLMAANLLGPGPGAPPLLVDWEYAQRTHPTWDIACLLAYYPVLEQRLDHLLGATGLSSVHDRQILSLQRRLFTRLNRLWEHAEAGSWIS